MPPSFETINYSLRPNKNIERKLMVECLQGLKPHFDLSTYKYIGLGSIWFVDFILFHKSLLIKDMISIERELDDAVRADFNKPYNCIRVEPGETTDILPTLNLENYKSIIWLDHDSGLEGPALKDNKIVCSRAKSGTIFIVTVNAHVNRLDRYDEGGRLIKKEETLRKLAGDLIPQRLPKGVLKVQEYPKFLSEILFDDLESSTRRSGRKERFYPIFNLYYRDGAPMVTVAGMIADEEEAALLADCKLSDKFPYAYGREQYKIEVPHLTSKEKILLDRLFPTADCPTSDAIEAQLGLKLRPEQIEAYYHLYRFYPMFGELLL